MTDSEFNRYSRAASQEALAEAGMANLEAGLAKCKTNSLKVNSLSPAAGGAEGNRTPDLCSAMMENRTSVDLHGNKNG